MGTAAGEQQFGSQGDNIIIYMCEQCIQYTLYMIVIANGIQFRFKLKKGLFVICSL